MLQGSTKILFGYTARMARRVAINISLTPELAGFIAAQVQSGRYGTASEVVRAALRQLETALPDENATPIIKIGAQ